MLIAVSLSALVALLHLYFMVLEMFLWTHPMGLKAFGNTPETARLTRTLAGNQGLYNGFLAAGIVWGLLSEQWNVVIFFLMCVLTAALYGAYSVNRRIFFVQGVPAIAALAAIMID